MREDLRPPHGRRPNAVFYNKTMLLKAGLRDPWADGKGDWTLDDMTTMARTVTRDLTATARSDQWGIAWAYTTSPHVAQFVWTRGGDVADLAKMQYTVDSPLAMDAHQQLYNWLVKDRLIISNAEITHIHAGLPRAQPLPRRQGGLPHARGERRAQLPARSKTRSSGTCCPSPSRERAAGRGSRSSPGNPHSGGPGQQGARSLPVATKHIAGPKGQEVLARTQSLPALKSKQEVFLTTPPTT